MRSDVTGQNWVESSPNLEAARNGLFFFLRNGFHRDEALQAEWNSHGEQAFHFEVLEKLKEDLSPIAVKDLLKEKKRLWAAKLRARTLSPV